jgi:hypothetical protein
MYLVQISLLERKKKEGMSVDTKTFGSSRCEC